MTTTALPLAAIVADMLDADWLSERVGRPVRASSLRVKPGASLTVGLARRADGVADGWARLLGPEARVKADKIHERALRRGQRIVLQSRPGGSLLIAGELAADPALAGPIRGAARSGWWPESGDVLRHNPMRRVVMRAGDRVVRVSAVPDRDALALTGVLAEAGVPTPERLDDGRDPYVGVRPFLGDTDLARTPDLTASRAAGHALHDVHRAAGGPGDRLAAVLGPRCSDPIAQALGAAEVLATLDPALADRLTQLATRAAPHLAGLAAPSTMLVHGDASPDQVLFDRRSGRIWWNDFDRASFGPPVVDLGSYLHALPDDSDGVALGRAFLAGYRDAGGPVPGDATLRSAMARAGLLRALDPLRAAAPDWRAGVAAQLDRVADLLP